VEKIPRQYARPKFQAQCDPSVCAVRTFSICHFAALMAGHKSGTYTKTNQQNERINMKRLREKKAFAAMLMLLTISLTLFPPQSRSTSSDGGQSECVGAQYNSDGESTDKKNCIQDTESLYSCSGNCYKYVVTGNTSNCKDCQETLLFWKYCTYTQNASTTVAGEAWSTACVSSGVGGCGCDTENWVYQGQQDCPCYHASGDGCVF
jgi:hypothetical protein